MVLRDQRHELSNLVRLRLARLQRLFRLDLRANRLTSLPDSIAQLPGLERLDLRWNGFATVPTPLRALERRGCTVYC